MSFCFVCVLTEVKPLKIARTFFFSCITCLLKWYAYSPKELTIIFRWKVRDFKDAFNFLAESLAISILPGLMTRLICMLPWERWPSFVTGTFHGIVGRGFITSQVCDKLRASWDVSLNRRVCLAIRIFLPWSWTKLGGMSETPKKHVFPNRHAPPGFTDQTSLLPSRNRRCCGPSFEDKAFCFPSYISTTSGKWRRHP